MPYFQNSASFPGARLTRRHGEERVWEKERGRGEGGGEEIKKTHTSWISHTHTHINMHINMQSYVERASLFN